MTTYKEIRGTQIEAVATDPSNPVEGQVWYNTTSNVLKGATGTPTLSWSTTNPMNTGRYGMGSAGTQTSALGFGGNGPSTQTAVTESWNGTNWTEVNDLNEGRYMLIGNGTSYTDCVAAGGDDFTSDSAKTETWNGTNWTEVNDMNTTREAGAGMGANSSSLFFVGGKIGSYGSDAVDSELTKNDQDWLKRKLKVAEIGANFDVSKMKKIVAGKKLWNYDNLEHTEKKGAI